MKNLLRNILCFIAVTAISVTVLSSCGKGGDNTGSSTPQSVSKPDSLIENLSRAESAEVTSRDSLSDSETEYLKKLFACMTSANFSSLSVLDDQMCLQFIENIINYQDMTGDKFFIDISPDSGGNYTMDKKTAENICKALFTRVLSHNSDYLIGDNYFFPAAGGVIPQVEITKTTVLGVIFQIHYSTQTGGSEKVKHIASVARSDNEYSPFRFQSLTINS